MRLISSLYFIFIQLEFEKRCLIFWLLEDLVSSILYSYFQIFYITGVKPSKGIKRVYFNFSLSLTALVFWIIPYPASAPPLDHFFENFLQRHLTETTSYLESLLGDGKKIEIDLRFTLQKKRTFYFSFFIRASHPLFPLLFVLPFFLLRVFSSHSVSGVEELKEKSFGTVECSSL